MIEEELIEIKRILLRIERLLASKPEPVTKMKKPTRISKRSWTDKQVHYLKTYYGEIPAERIALALKKTKKAVYAEAHRLGLTTQKLSKIDGKNCIECGKKLSFGLCKNRECGQFGIVQVANSKKATSEEARKYNKELIDDEPS